MVHPMADPTDAPMIAELEETACDPEFPILCPQCSEPMMVHAMAAWCLSRTCEVYEHQWVGGRWVEDEDTRLSLRQLESFDAVIKDLGGY